METVSRVLPNRPMVEVEDADATFHTVYDLDHRYQINSWFAPKVRSDSEATG